MSQTTLEETFKRVIAETATKVEAFGFRRRDNLLRITGQGNSGLIEFQRSTKNSKERLLFTVNLAVVCGELLEPDEPPVDKARSPNGHLRERIGRLLPVRQDKWWEITVRTDSNALAAEVSELIAREAVPYVVRFLDTKELVALWRSGMSPGLTEFQRNRYLGSLSPGQ
jgi:hypothetical protein